MTSLDPTSFERPDASSDARATLPRCGGSANCLTQKRFPSPEFHGLLTADNWNGQKLSRITAANSRYSQSISTKLEPVFDRARPLRSGKTGQEVAVSYPNLIRVTHKFAQQRVEFLHID